MSPKGPPEFKDGGECFAPCNGVFLLRLRQRKCNFEAPEPSQIHFLRFPNIFQKIEIFIIFWSIFTPAGHPSIIPPTAIPCDSPNVVREKILPNLFPDTIRTFMQI